MIVQIRLLIVKIIINYNKNKQIAQLKIFKNKMFHLIMEKRRKFIVRNIMKILVCKIKFILIFKDFQEH